MKNIRPFLFLPLGAVAAVSLLAQPADATAGTDAPDDVKPMTERILKKFDADGNGELSVTELDAAMRHIRERMEQRRDDRGPRNGRSDRRGFDGPGGPGMGMGGGPRGDFGPGRDFGPPPERGMRTEKGAEGKGPRGPRLDPEQRATVLLALYDANEDGRLDEAELITAMENTPLHGPPPAEGTEE